jgi:putative ABC transport system substrate-binding protein
MRRRAFISLLGGAAAWPAWARAQLTERVRRIGLLMAFIESDQEGQTIAATFREGLLKSGWTEGRNIRIDTRWAGGDLDRVRSLATELVALAPDVIVTGGASYVTALLQATRTVPIVFATATDPVGGGLVASLARPGGNVTGFTLFEYGTSGKWLELLKEIAPGVTRAAVIQDPSITSGTGQLAAIQAVAPSLGVELTPVDVREASGIEHSIAGFTQGSDCGLIVTISPLAVRHRELIIALAARHRLPAVYPERPFVVAGGLISYGLNYAGQFRQAAGYVDRILKGEKPADLPVQAPTKFELVINLKTANALGLQIPDKLLALADEVIE